MAALRSDAHAADPLHERSGSVAVAELRRTSGLPPRRPTSARASIVQQKLQSALSQAEKSVSELTAVESQASFRSKRFSAAEDELQCDRSVYRYRGEAAIVSFSDPANPFAYSSNFLPGAHFYTFLASKDLPKPSSYHHSSVQDSGGTTGGAETGATGGETDVHGDGGAGKLSALASTRKKTALRMWIPDTVVYGETGRAVWLSSDKDGFVQRCTDFSERQVLEKFSNPIASDTERAVVVYKEAVVSNLKRPSKRSSSPDNGGALKSLGNQLRLLSPGELKTLLSHVANSKKSFAVQQFVKCNGSKAFIVRSVHEAGKPASAWMISNIVPFQEASSSNSSNSAAEQHGTGADINTAMSQGATIASPRGQQQSTSTESSAPAETTANPPFEATTTSAAAAVVVPLVNRLCTSVQVDKSCTFVKLNERGCATVSELNLRVRTFDLLAIPDVRPLCHCLILCESCCSLSSTLSRSSTFNCRRWLPTS